MRNKAEQDYIAISLISIAQAILNGAFVLTNFTSSSNVQGAAHIEFNMIACDPPSGQDRANSAGSETLQ